MAYPGGAGAPDLAFLGSARTPEFACCVDSVSAGAASQSQASDRTLLRAHTLLLFTPPMPTGAPSRLHKARHDGSPTVRDVVMLQARRKEYTEPNNHVTVTGLQLRERCLLPEVREPASHTCNKGFRTGRSKVFSLTLWDWSMQHACSGRVLDGPPVYCRHPATQSLLAAGFPEQRAAIYSPRHSGAACCYWRKPAPSRVDLSKCASFQPQECFGRFRYAEGGLI